MDCGLFFVRLFPELLEELLLFLSKMIESTARVAGGECTLRLVSKVGVLGLLLLLVAVMLSLGRSADLLRLPVRDSALPVDLR